MKGINDGMPGYAETSRRLINEAGRMVNLMVTAGYGWSDALMAQCAHYGTADVELSEFLQAPPGTGCQRSLSVVAPFVAEGTGQVIPPQSLVLVPNVLRVFATRFRVGVRGPDYVSGTYRGRIRLTGLPGTPAQEMDVIVGL